MILGQKKAHTDYEIVLKIFEKMFSLSKIMFI